MKIKKNVLYLLCNCPFYVFELLPLANLDIETCNKVISKTITASILRFGQLIEDGE